jgi:hypothetical protein
MSNRSIRTNNPGNIKYSRSIKWVGQTGTDGVNAVFRTPVHGARAMSVTLKTYYLTHNLNTVDGIINRWAPPSENDTQNYINYVVANLQEKGYNVDANSSLNLEDNPQLKTDMMKAMTELEGDNENYFTTEVLRQGVDATSKADGEFQSTSNPSSSASQNPAPSTTNQNNSITGPNNVAGEGGSSPPSGDLGFKDPENEYPLEPYQTEQGLNKAARAGDPEWETRLGLPSSAVGKDLLPKDFDPQYPSNKVYETEDGHRIELDDTVGTPRIEYAHMNGSGFSIENDKSNSRMLVNSYGDMVELVGRDFTMIVNGNGDILYTGNLNLTVEGNMDLNVKKDLTFRVGGTYREFIEERQITRIQGKNLRSGAPAKSEHIGGSSELLVLDNYLVEVSDDYEIIAGFIRQGSEGGVHIAAGSSGDYKINANNVQIASNDLTTTSSSINIGAGSGQIGGDAVKGSFGEFGLFNSALATANKLTNSAQGLTKKFRQAFTSTTQKAASKIGENKSDSKTPDQFSSGGGGGF